MARNLFEYALLGGVAGGANAYAQGMADEERARREFEMRKALQDDQQSFREQLGVGGRGQGAATGVGRGGAPAVTADQAVETANKILAMPSREDVAKLYPDAPTQVDPAEYADGTALPEGQAGPTRPGYTDADGKPLPVRRVLDDTFYKQKADEIVRYRKVVYGGANADDMAKGEQTLVETNLLERAGGGDRKAGEGLLYAKGKDPVETEARADAQTAKAEKDNRTDPNARRGGAGGAPKAPRLQSTKVDAQGFLLGVMSDGSVQPLKGPDGKQIMSAELNNKLEPIKKRLTENVTGFSKLPAAEQHRMALENYLGGVAKPAAAAPAPAQSGGSASAPPVDRLKEGVLTTFKNGETWTLKNGKPVKV